MKSFLKGSVRSGGPWQPKSAVSESVNRQQEKNLAPLRFAFLASLMSRPISVNMKVGNRCTVKCEKAFGKQIFFCRVLDAIKFL